MTLTCPDNAYIINKLINFFKFTKGAELGVRRGEFSAYLLQENKSLVMSCVDLWDDHESLNEKHPHNFNYTTYKNNIEPYKDRALELKMLLDSAAAIHENNTLDFVFIDATHTYDGVKNDYYTWLPKVKSGGLISGHDYHPNFDKGGMIKAINEFDSGIKVISSQEEVMNKLKNKENVVDLVSTCWYIWKK